MKRSIAMLFVVIMILSCMPVMANTVPGESAVTTAAATKSKKATVKNGWVKSGSTFKYYVNGKYRKNGIFTIDGVNYAFDSKGKMQTGWVTFSKKKYYASKNQGAKGKGAILTGLLLPRSRQEGRRDKGLCHVERQEVLLRFRDRQTAPHARLVLHRQLYVLYPC